MCVSLTDGYLPVIIMHGILDDYTSMDELVEFIQESHKGTTVYNIDAFNNIVMQNESNTLLVFGIPALTNRIVS